MRHLRSLALCALPWVILAGCTAASEEGAGYDVDAQAQELGDKDTVVLLEPVPAGDENCTEGLLDCLWDTFGMCPRCRGVIGPMLGWDKGMQCPDSLSDVLNRETPPGQLPDLGTFKATDCVILVGNAPNTFVPPGVILQEEVKKVGGRIAYRVSTWAGNAVLRWLGQRVAPVLGQMAVTMGGRVVETPVVASPDATPEQVREMQKDVANMPAGGNFAPGLATCN